MLSTVNPASPESAITKSVPVPDAMLPSVSDKAAVEPSEATPPVRPSPAVVIAAT
jgi:hypothetical protein